MRRMKPSCHLFFWQHHRGISLLVVARCLTRVGGKDRPSVVPSMKGIENDTVFTGYEFGRPCEDKYNNILIPEEYILY
jgi:hypothetical protein